jgi:hypothetical protein
MSARAPILAFLLLLPAVPALAQSVDDLVGRWGVASYWKAEDKAEAPGWARQGCGQPYVIEKNAAGNLMMYVADGELREVRLRGKTLTPTDRLEGGAKKYEREITEFGPKSFELTWTNGGLAGRYGTVVYVRCGG